jgi:hypothetical protein
MKSRIQPPQILPAALVGLSVLVLQCNANAQVVTPGQGPAMDPDKARVVDYWTEERRRGATSRDLVVDPRGLGYLRRPDGSLAPYGHQITAEAASSSPSPAARPSGGNDDSTPPSITIVNPAEGATIGSSATFSAIVTDDSSGVRSVSFVIEYPGGSQTQTFSASEGGGNVWSVTLQGFSDGDWSWSVVAKDRAKRGGNEATEGPINFQVDTGGGSGGGGGGGGSGGTGTVTNAQWDVDGSPLHQSVGRLYFEMPNNAKLKGPWGGYVCSGTVVTDTFDDRSIILTAAHCVYDDVNKAFARNVLFIPDQAATTGSGTDTNCNNDPLGCWVPSFGVVDVGWTERTFPNNIPWDYAYYVVEDTGAHAGAGASSENLEHAVQPVAVDFNEPDHDDGTAGAETNDFTHALGYSYSEDPMLMYCAEDMATEGALNWWLPNCGLSGGSSGGPWVQPMSSAGMGSLISVNSWGYTNEPGMAGPRLDISSALCVFDTATLTGWDEIDDSDGKAGRSVDCNFNP